MFNAIQEDPPIIMGFPVEAHFGGGAFSLDGIHPSNVGQLIIAQAFIAAANRSLGAGFTTVSDVDLTRAMLRDPFQDKDGDGRVAGRARGSMRP